MKQLKNNGKMNKKSQISTIDVLVAVFIFAVVFTIIMINWHNYSVKLTNKLEREVILSQAIEITDVLVKTQGAPTNWNRTNVELIGLASSDRKISEEKVQEFCNITYNTTKQIFGLLYDYDFHIESYSTDIFSEGSWSEEIMCGKAVGTDVRKVVSLRRSITYKNKTSALIFSLWR